MVATLYTTYILVIVAVIVPVIIHVIILVIVSVIILVIVASQNLTGGEVGLILNLTGGEWV